jgi:hypothetical protein
VLFFIQKKTGAIFGAKSHIAPNLRHYYGTLYTTDKWDWTAEVPTPRDVTTAEVREVGFYKTYKHYIPTNKALYKAIFGHELVEVEKLALDTAAAG